MSNILNLLTASIIAVSPIVSQPKMADRPHNVLYENVEYLDNNYVVSSYIISEEVYNYFLVQIKNGNTVDFEYSIGISEDTFVTNGSILGNNPDSFSYEKTYRLPTESEYLEFSEMDQFLIWFNYTDANDELKANSDIIDFVGSDFIFDNGPMSLILDLSNSDLSLSSREKLNLSYNLKENNLFNLFMDRYFFEIKGPGIIDNTFAVVGNTIEEYVSVVVNLFSQVLALFIVNGQLTILGILLIFTFGIGVVKFGFEFIKSLLRL